jgi:hypothetical protein
VIYPQFVRFFDLDAYQVVPVVGGTAPPMKTMPSIVGIGLALLDNRGVPIALKFFGRIVFSAIVAAIFSRTSWKLSRGGKMAGFCTYVVLSLITVDELVSS